jgi:hypothetical protein
MMDINNFKFNGGYIMRKILIILALFVFILTGTSLAAPISLNNVVTFNSCLDGQGLDDSWTNTSDWAIGEIGTGTYNYNISFQNGFLTVTLASLGGDSYIDCSSHRGHHDSPAPVPEPASMVLIGLGMLSVGFFARKRNKSHK